MNNLRKILVLTVTYGDRYKEITNGPLSLDRVSGHKTLVICNGVSSSCHKKLLEYRRTSQKDIDFIFTKQNLGSAGGFKLGLDSCKNYDFDYVLLLDDDNYISEQDFNKIYKYSLSEAQFVLRSGRSYIQIAASGKDPSQLIARDNSFLGFELLRLLKKRFLSAKNIKKNYVFPWAPYGGLLVSKRVVDSNIRPNENYYLYCDDTEYTNKISKKFGLYLLQDISVIDTAASWNTEDKGNVINRIIWGKDDWRIYYSLRNQSHFDKNRSNNSIIFYFNLIAFISVFFVTISCLFLTGKRINYIKRIGLITNAIYEGLFGKLGYRGINW